MQVKSKLHSFDIVLDELYGKPGTPSRDAFRREARAFCEEKTASKKAAEHKTVVLSH